MCCVLHFIHICSGIFYDAFVGTTTLIHGGLNVVVSTLVGKSGKHVSKVRGSDLV